VGGHNKIEGEGALWAQSVRLAKSELAMDHEGAFADFIDDFRALGLFVRWGYDGSLDAARALPCQRQRLVELARRGNNVSVYALNVEIFGMVDGADSQTRPLAGLGLQAPRAADGGFPA